MITRISTGTGLVLLAGAIVFHAVVTTGAGTTEAIAAPVWTPVMTAAATEPQNAPPGSAPAAVTAVAGPVRASGAPEVVKVASAPLVVPAAFVATTR